MKTYQRLPISSAKLAEIYGTTPQRIRQLVRTYDYLVVSNPNALFTTLLAHGTDSPLRRRLTPKASRDDFSRKIQTAFHK